MKRRIEKRLSRHSTQNIGQPCGEVKVLTYNSLPIRMVEANGDIYLSATDVAKAMGMYNGRITRLYLPEEQSPMFSISTPGGVQPVRMVSLKGIIRILNKSKKPESALLVEWLFNRFMVVVSETAPISEGTWASL